MRPYNIREDDNKYIHPAISNIPGIQPSPLALLAATCSRIGETFQDDNAVFTQKTFCYEKGKDDVTNTKSCVDTRASAFVCLDRNLDIQQNPSPPYTPAPQIMSPCYKIKYEESYDYNQNCEGLNICPNVIAEARMLEAQARVSFSKSCSHEAITTTSCHGPVNSTGNINFSNSSCEMLQRSPSSSSDISCFYQNSPVNSSCAVENSNFQGSALAHLPSAIQVVNDIPSITQSVHYSNLENFQRPNKQYSSWQSSQQQFNRNGSTLTSVEKSSFMMYENFENNMSLQTFHNNNNNNNNRNNKNSLSHITSPTLSNYRSNHSTLPNQQIFQAPNHNPHTYQHYSNYNTPVDVKPDPFTINQQNYRQPTSPCIPPAQDFHSSQNAMKWPNQSSVNPIQHTPQDHLTDMAAPESMNAPMHNHPVNPIQHTPQDHLTDMAVPESMNAPMHNHPLGITSSFCNTCNSQSNMGMPQNAGEIMGVNSMTNPEMQSQNLAEYQYQQQQMFYARDNRRPRRIACTCPNCRDGENKTVTTKDGKQRKLHVCHVSGCGKIYGKTSHLRAHLRWHAGERPFACNWLFCNKRFTRSDELQRHRRTHTGDKRFECSTCLKKFMRSDHLSKHMKTHQTQNKDKNNDSVFPEKTKLKNVKDEETKTSTSLGISESLKL